jgi:hypothetical protein
MLLLKDREVEACPVAIIVVSAFSSISTALEEIVGGRVRGRRSGRRRGRSSSVQGQVGGRRVQKRMCIAFVDHLRLSSSLVYINDII